MYWIYCYTNKINDHKYVGQTNNQKRRIREHRSCAFNKNSSSYNDLIHQKIRQYGEENFEISVLEILYTTDIKEVDKREQYWIKTLDTFRGNHKGYNSDLGGGNRIKNSILTETQIQELKKEIKAGCPYYDLEFKYAISASFISSINNGLYFYDENEQYPLYKYYKNDEDYSELIELLTNSSLTLVDIAKNLGLGYSTVKKINAGLLKKDLYPTHPIRKKTAYGMRADEIKEFLLTTNYSNKQIAEIVGSSEETVRRIKIGQCFKDDNLSYPLQNL